MRLLFHSRLDRRRPAPGRLDRICRELFRRGRVREYTVAHVAQDGERVTFCAGIALETKIQPRQCLSTLQTAMVGDIIAVRRT